MFTTANAARRLVAVFAAVLVAMPLASLSTRADTGLSAGASVSVTSTDPVLVRTTPGYDAPVASEVASGAALTVESGPVADSTGTLWYQVNAGGFVPAYAIAPVSTGQTLQAWQDTGDPNATDSGYTDQSQDASADTTWQQDAAPADPSYTDQAQEVPADPNYVEAAPADQTGQDGGWVDPNATTDQTAQDGTWVDPNAQPAPDPNAQSQDGTWVDPNAQPAPDPNAQSQDGGWVDPNANGDPNAQGQAQDGGWVDPNAAPADPNAQQQDPNAQGQQDGGWVDPNAQPAPDPNAQNQDGAWVDPNAQQDPNANVDPNATGDQTAQDGTWVDPNNGQDPNATADQGQTGQEPVVTDDAVYSEPTPEPEQAPADQPAPKGKKGNKGGNAGNNGNSSTSNNGGGSSSGNAAADGQKIVDYAMGFLGYPYAYAGEGPYAFDCSGFTKYVVMQTLGIDITHDMATQVGMGQSVSKNQLEPGDLVFFEDTFEPGLSHAGIYIGNGQFIHAENESTGVRISDLNSDYYGPRWYGAVRLP